jgi:hypothetical protein
MSGKRINNSARFAHFAFGLPQMDFYFRRSHSLKKDSGTGFWTPFWMAIPFRSLEFHPLIYDRHWTSPWWIDQKIFWLCYRGSRDTFVTKSRSESVLHHWSDQYNSHHALRRPRPFSFVTELTDRSLVVGSMQQRVVRRMIDEKFLRRDSSEMLQRGCKFGLKSRYQLEI